MRYARTPAQAGCRVPHQPSGYRTALKQLLYRPPATLPGPQQRLAEVDRRRRTSRAGFTPAESRAPRKRF